jgi:putative glutamine amidotransferase
MKTLGVSKMGMNGCKYYEGLLNNIVNTKEIFKVESVNFDKSYDFIIFDGGSDVTPKLYGEEKHKETFNNELRDQYEQNIFNKYFKTATKFIGICRGSQFLNVMFGGTLYQHLDDYNLQHPSFHTIKVLENIEVINDVEKSLRTILPEYTMVNSTHHQAVKNLGKGLFITAHDAHNFIVESYASFDDKVRATQFHPEFYNDFPYTIPILKWLFRDL